MSSTRRRQERARARLQPRCALRRLQRPYGEAPPPVVLAVRRSDARHRQLSIGPAMSGPSLRFCFLMQCRQWMPSSRPDRSVDLLFALTHTNAFHHALAT